MLASTKNRFFRGVWLCLCAMAVPAMGQIYAWTDGGNSTHVIPGTEAITPGPGIDLSGWDTPSHNLNNAGLTYNLSPSGEIFSNNVPLDLTGANFSDSWLNHANFYDTVLDSVNFSGADLGGSDLVNASLHYTNFTDSTIDGAILGDMTQAQFESTASYKTGNLQGINFTLSDTLGWNLTGCDLTGASMYIVGINLTDAIVANCSIGTGGNGYEVNVPALLSVTASYKSKDLHGVNFGESNLTNWDLSGQNLTNTTLSTAILTGVDFTNAVVAGADFSPDTEGGNLNPVPISLAQLESTASYKNHDLHGVSLYRLSFPGIDFQNQNLHGALLICDLTGANLAGSDLTGTTLGAQIVGADFTNAAISQIRIDHDVPWPFTNAQLVSTASYKHKDLHGLWVAHGGAMAGLNFSAFDLSGGLFFYVDFTGDNFSGANLSGTYFGDCDFMNAIFTNATITGTTLRSEGFTAEDLYATASYRSHNLRGVSLYPIGPLDLSYQDLTGASVAAVPGSNLTGAIIANASIGYMTEAQLDSTASFQNKDLHGIIFRAGTQAGWNFNGQNLAGANLDGDFTGATFRQADLTGAIIGHYSNSRICTNCDFTGACLINVDGTAYPFFSNAIFVDADLRGSTHVYGPDVGEVLRNTILPDGTIQGLDLLAGDQLTMRNDPIAITVQTAMAFEQNSVLQFDFDASPWQSTITAPAGVTPVLGGTLSLAFENGVNPAALVGTSYQLFNWSGPLPDGDEFGQITSPLPPGLYWDLSNLYATGKITLLPEPAVWMGLVGLLAWSLMRPRRAAS